MKQTPDYSKAYENMKEGIITKSGFIGSDTRTLKDIIIHDESLMKQLGLTYEEIVDKLNYFFEQGKKGLGEPITVDSKWIVKIDEARGKLPCPFKDGMFEKINIRVSNIKINEFLDYSILSIHLIEKHHFFQGKGSIYRLDPGHIKKVLEL